MEGENLGLWMYLVQRLELGPGLFCSLAINAALGILCAELPDLSEALARPKYQIIASKVFLRENKEIFSPRRKALVTLTALNKFSLAA